MEVTLALIREDVKNAPEYDCERGFDAAFRAELNTCFGHARRPPAIENESNDNLAPLLNDDEARHLLDRWRGLRRGIEAGDLAAVNAADRLVAQALVRLARGLQLRAGTARSSNGTGADTHPQLAQLLARYDSFFRCVLDPATLPRQTE